MQLNPHFSVLVRFVVIVMLFCTTTTNIFAVETVCNLRMDGNTRPRGTVFDIQRNTAKTIRVFVNYGDLVGRVGDNASNISYAIGATGSGGLNGCNTFVDILITASATASLGTITITLYGVGDSKTCDFQVRIMPIPVSPTECDTPERVFALLLGKVVVGTPTDADQTGLPPMLVNFNSELFLVAQDAALNTDCDAKISFHIYYSTTSASLDNLANLAAANDNFALPVGVLKVACTKSRVANSIACAATIAQGTIKAGNIIHYRIGKRITKAGTTDAYDSYRFSTTYNFIAPNKLPTANAGANKSVVVPPTTNTLSGSATDTDGTISTYAWAQIGTTPSVATIASATTATPAIGNLVVGTYTFRLTVMDNSGSTATDDIVLTCTAAPKPNLIPDGITQPLYGGLNSTVEDKTYTYYRLDESFCKSLPALSTYTEEGSLPLPSFQTTPDRRIMRLNYPMPTLDFYYKNNGLGATGGIFTVQVLKGTSTTPLRPDATVAALAAGASGHVSYATRGTAIVYRFPGFDPPETDTRYCYVREEINHTFPATLERDGITLKVDSANVIIETNEADNNQLYKAGVTVVLPH